MSKVEHTEYHSLSPPRKPRVRCEACYGAVRVREGFLVDLCTSCRETVNKEITRIRYRQIAEQMAEQMAS